jgi:glycosyltransferase involved in cell wall biosynthesis
MAAALVNPEVPLLISVWGNDFTLHAASTPWMKRYTRMAMERADALHTDCQRDMRLAQAWGFSPEKLSVVLPGAGGLQLDLFHPPSPGAGGAQREVTVINPRGFRTYVRNDTFFRAIPLVLKRFPQARFICPAMAGETQTQRWLDRLGIAGSVVLLPLQSRAQMAELFRSARVAVSPSTHDGTPNTLLEAMACGCLPVAGDIESLREWIVPGSNGLLVDPGYPQGLAQAIITALEEEELCQRALEYNTRLVQERAVYGRVMEKAESFYKELIVKSGLRAG